MTFYFDKVFLQDTSTVCGPYEKSGPLGRYFDKSYDDLYFGEKSWEKAEIHLVQESIQILLNKCGLTNFDIDLIVGGDLLNQITATTYGSCGCGKSFIGLYAACSTSVLGMIIASCFIQGDYLHRALCVVSSHNMSSEKQFRYPTEYGSIRPDSATFTSTGGACCLLTSNPSSIRVECATLGKIVDYDQNDPNDMGRVMAPSVIDTLVQHFSDTGRSPDDYDLILSGDLGKYGVEIVKDYMKENFDVVLGKKYNDCGVLLYDLNLQKEIKAGGSGPVCSALVAYSYVYSLLKKKKIKRVLLLATGAYFSPTLLFQKENIYSICHAISLEVV